MPYPVEATETDGYTPDSLRNIPTPPKFMFRTATNRDERAFRKYLLEEGLVSHSVHSIRDSLLAGFKDGWSPESYDKGETRLKVYWEALDYAEKEGQPVVFDEAEAKQLEALTREIVQHWRPVRVMVAENETFKEMIAKIAISMYCIGWQGIDLPYRREANVVPLDLVDDLESKMLSIEQANANCEGVENGLSFTELSIHALNAMKLTRDEEKNSSSLLPNDSTQEPSGNGKEATTASKSQAKSSTSEQSA